MKKMMLGMLLVSGAVSCARATAGPSNPILDKVGLEKAASGRVSLDQTYDNQAAGTTALPIDGALGAQKNTARLGLTARSPLSVKDEAAPPSPRLVAAARKGVEKADAETASMGFVAGFSAVFLEPMAALCSVPVVGWIAAAVVAGPLFVTGLIVGGIGAYIGAFL